MRWPIELQRSGHHESGRSEMSPAMLICEWLRMVKIANANHHPTATATGLWRLLRQVVLHTTGDSQHVQVTSLLAQHGKPWTQCRMERSEWNDPNGMILMECLWKPVEPMLGEAAQLGNRDISHLTGWNWILITVFPWTYRQDCSAKLSNTKLLEDDSRWQQMTGQWRRWQVLLGQTHWVASSRVLPSEINCEVL